LPEEITLTFRDGTKLVVPANTTIKVHLGLFCEPTLSFAQTPTGGKVDLDWGPRVKKKITTVKRANP